MVGTGFFMLAHLLYIVGFRSGQKVKTLKKRYRMMRSIAYAVIVVAAIGNIYLLW